MLLFERTPVAYLFAVESLGSVEGLDERRRMTDEESIARGTGQHADHR